MSDRLAVVKKETFLSVYSKNSKIKFFLSFCVCSLYISGRLQFCFLGRADTMLGSSCIGR